MKMNKILYIKPELAVVQLELPQLLNNSVTVKVDDVNDELIDDGNSTGSTSNALGRRFDLFEDEEDYEY